MVSLDSVLKTQQFVSVLCVSRPLVRTVVSWSLGSLWCSAVSRGPGTLGGLFSQILQGEDIVRERAIKFLSGKLKTLPEDVMTKEVEDYVFAETKKVRVSTSPN